MSIYTFVRVGLSMLVRWIFRKSIKDNFREIHGSFCIYNDVDYSEDEYCLYLIQGYFDVEAKLTQVINKHTQLVQLLLLTN